MCQHFQLLLLLLSCKISLVANFAQKKKKRTFAHTHFMPDFVVIFLKHIRVWFKIQWSQWETFHLTSVKWSDTKKAARWNFWLYNLAEYLFCLSSISCVFSDSVKGSKSSLYSEYFIRPTQPGIAKNKMSFAKGSLRNYLADAPSLLVHSIYSR